VPNVAPTKMKITAYSDQNFNTKVPGASNPFTVWMNPQSYSYQKGVSYNDRQAQGSPGPSPAFNRVAQEDVSFELMFDATGAGPPPSGQTDLSSGVTDGITQFTTLMATVNGKVHSPNYLILSWAQLQFQCVLSSLKIDYTLFRPDGTPLRAKVSVSFKSFTSETQLAKQANTNSPDLTHVVTVWAGDTLPLLCHEIYGDSGFYLKVAAFNELVTFRTLVPGTQLLFPPLEGSRQ
jgi:hypothetical protein